MLWLVRTYRGGGFMGFENLEVWKRSSRLSADIYCGLKDLKDFGFKDQITGSGLSVPSNIAEGAERSTQQQTINFLNYAKGSCGELKTQIYIGIEINYIPADLGKQWIKEVNTISAMLGALMRNRRERLTQKTP